MKRLLKAIIQKIYVMFNTCFEDIAEGIETNNRLQIVMNIVEIFVKGAVCLAVAGCLVYLTLQFWWITLGVLFLIWLGQKLLENSDTTPEVNPGGDEVEKALVIERATEQQDEVRALAFAAIQGASTTTPLVRPHDEYDIQPSKASGKCFYLNREKIPVYQWEADLEVEIDKTQEDIILRELQRYIVKNLPRFPMLLSDEARGRAAVEVLDVKNLGGHVLIEMVLVNSASIPLVEARRRARAERQQRQKAITDMDYCE